VYPKHHRRSFYQSVWHRPFSERELTIVVSNSVKCDITCAKSHKIINNSAGDCSISLTFRTDFDHLTLDVSRTFKVNGSSEFKVTACRNVSASKNALIQARISCRRSNLVKIVPEPSATRNSMFKVIRSNTEIAITPPRIARLRSNLVQSFITSQAIHCQCSRSKVKGQGHSVK